MEEEKKFQEAEIEQIKNEDAKVEEAISELKEGEKKKKAEIYVELALILILGILIGVALKTEAVRRITIGFDDHLMKIYKQDYDINQMQMNLSQEIAEEPQETQE